MIDEAQIDEGDSEVVVFVDSSVNPHNSLTATFTLSEGASSVPLSPITNGDFTSPVEITVTAEDDTERIWTIYVVEPT